MAASWALGPSFGKRESTFPSGAIYGLPQAFSGVILIFFSIGITTLIPSSGLFTCILPRSQTILVGDFISFMPAGTVPVHLGPVIKNVSASVPVVLLPGDEKIFVNASSMGKR